MAGETIFIAHPAQGTVQRIFADGLLRIAAMCEQVALGRLDLVQQVADDLDSLDGQRHDVGRHVLRPFASFTHVVLQLLDVLRRYKPQPPFKVEQIGRGRAQLAGPHPRQQQQPDTELGLRATPPVGTQLLQHRRKLFQEQKGVVGDRRLGHRNDIQIRGGIGLEFFHHDQSVAEQLAEPATNFLSRRKGFALLDPEQQL